MANIVQVECNNMLNASLGIASYTATTTPIKLRLLSANGSATSAGTAVTGGSYADLSLATLMTTSTTGSSSNNAALNFTNMPAITVTGVEIWDSAGTPVRKWFGALTASKTTNAGDTLSFSTGSLTLGLS
jgi:hypothetical protein